MSIVLLALALSGCAGSTSPSPWLVDRPLSAPKACAALTADQELVVNLSQEMVDSGRLHAALANLERLPPELPEARLRKARILRVLGRDEAETLYRSLLGTCLVAEGQHGLGQIAATRNDHRQALEHLRAAASLSPANSAMRNDLGVVYMNMRSLPESQFELMTAMELSENDQRAAENLLTLLLYQDNWQQASTLSSAKRLTPDRFREAERRAQRMKHEDQVPVPVSVPAVAVVASPPAEATRPTDNAAPATDRRDSSPPASPLVTPVAVVEVPAAAASTPPPVARAPLSRSELLFGHSTSSVVGVQHVPSAPARPLVPITGVEDQETAAQ